MWNGVAMSESVEQRVLRVIAANQRIPVESVTADSTFEGLGIDSLDRLNILFDLEGEFDIQINDEQAKTVTNMQELVEGIQKLLDAKDASAKEAS
jgi:acyl carrier protein